METLGLEVGEEGFPRSTSRALCGYLRDRCDDIEGSLPNESY
jgi:hypothetical protein